MIYNIVMKKEKAKNNAFVTFIKKLSVKNFIMLTVAGIVNAIGVTMFIAPVNLYDSGISGTSILLEQVTSLPLSLFLVIINVPLFLFGLKKQGAAFTIYAVYVVVIYSVCAFLINEVLPIDVSIASPLADQDLLLCAIFGGVISGAGSGIAIRYGGAMDGVEVLAVIFAKKLGITVGTFVMIYNLILYVVCGILLKSWILPLYSIITYAVGLKAVDFIVEGLDRSKSAMIITDKPNEVCKALITAFESGATKIEATGGFSDSPKTVIYFVVNRFQIGKMKAIVHEIDEKAYITISEVADVFKYKK